MNSAPPPKVTLPPPFKEHSGGEPLVVIAQGAEGIVYKTTFLTAGTACALKYRPAKAYRHPVLDRRLTKARILAEARTLLRCRRDGVDVPGVLAIDADAGWLITEWIPGPTVRAFLDDPMAGSGSGSGSCPRPNITLPTLMEQIGRAVARLHQTGAVHGDLTTSNMILRPSESGPGREADDAHDAEPKITSLVLIDFGLASQTSHDEDRAVDLYVLERAFAATHPRAEPLFERVLRAYAAALGGGGGAGGGGAGGGAAASSVLRKLDDVRARGRKRSMLG